MQLQRSKLANGTPDIEAGSGATVPQAKWYSFISPIFIQAFTLTFLAEWGDRSQLTTIILAAREVCRVSAVAALTCLYACLAILKMPFVSSVGVTIFPHDGKSIQYFAQRKESGWEHKHPNTLLVNSNRLDPLFHEPHGPESSRPEPGIATCMSSPGGLDAFVCLL